MSQCLHLLGMVVLPRWLVTLQCRPRASLASQLHHNATTHVIHLCPKSQLRQTMQPSGARIAQNRQGVPNRAFHVLQLTDQVASAWLFPSLPALEEGFRQTHGHELCRM